MSDSKLQTNKNKRSRRIDDILNGNVRDLTFFVFVKLHFLMTSILLSLWNPVIIFFNFTIINTSFHFLTEFWMYYYYYTGKIYFIFSFPLKDINTFLSNYHSRTLNYIHYFVIQYMFTITLSYSILMSKKNLQKKKEKLTFDISITFDRFIFIGFLCAEIWLFFLVLWQSRPFHLTYRCFYSFQLLLNSVFSFFLFF